MTETDTRHRQGEPYPLEEPEASLGDVTGRLVSDMGALVNDHIALARLEITEDIKKAGKGAGLLGGGAVAGWITALLLSMALAFGLAEGMDTWLAFLIVGALWLVVTAVTMAMGKKRMDDIEPAPQQTMDELERDKEWMRNLR